MKTKEPKTNLRNKTAEELQQELMSLLQEQFNLKMQRGLLESPKTHVFKTVRRNIARIKTLLHEKQQQPKA